VLSEPSMLWLMFLRLNVSLDAAKIAI